MGNSQGSGGGAGGGYDTPASLVAKLLAQPRRHTLLAFLSPNCGLCAKLRPALSQAEIEGGTRLSVARLNALQDTLWAPELLRYDVEAVPCFLLLRPDGEAVCKTGPPTSAREMAADLDRMLAAAAEGR